MNRLQFCVSWLVATSVLTTGCASDHQGYLLRTDDGQRSVITFHDNPSGRRGKVDAVLAGGERCQGQFNTVPDQVTRNWENPNEVESEDTLVGVAMLNCPNHHVVKCNFSRAHEDGGIGECLDTDGRKYSLNF